MNEPQVKLRYRPDVDGLRAIAVLSVIAFHFALPGVPGGYLGVDVFFVISGYLITTIIWSEIIDGRFTLARFYERRIRRIMPALLLVLVVTTGLALVLLLPGDLLGYAKSLLATLAFLANVYFWRDTNYFARAAEDKPLLHMWSLGVEEQFYVLFPLLLVLLARHWPRMTLWVLAATVLLSFAANLGLNMIGGRNPAFYLLPTRAWELGLGAIVALMPAARAPGRRSAQIVAAAGLVLIVLGMGFSDRFRGAVPETLPAVVGTALVIWAGSTQRTLVGSLLSTRAMLFFGRLSYSLYLWHWPVVVFAGYYLVRALTGFETVLAFVLILALAMFSLRFVENPLRAKTVPFRIVALWVVSATVLLVIGSLAILRSDGFAGRLSPEAAKINAAAGTNYRCSVADYIAFEGARACRLNLPSGDRNDAQVVLFGNSHAQMYAPIIRDMTTEAGLSSILVPMNGCLPMTSVNIGTGCIALAERNIAAILALPDVSRVILAFNWEIQARQLVAADGRPVAEFDAAFRAGLDEMLTRIEDAGKDVVLVGPIPIPGWDVASELSRALAFGRTTTMPLEEPLDAFRDRYASVVAPLRARLGARFIEPANAICDETACRWIIDGRSVFSDANHVAEAELPLFRVYFEGILTE